MQPTIFVVAALEALVDAGEDDVLVLLGVAVGDGVSVAVIVDVEEGEGLSTGGGVGTELLAQLVSTKVVIAASVRKVFFIMSPK